MVQLWKAIQTQIVEGKDKSIKIDNIQSKLKTPLLNIPTIKSQFPEMNQHPINSKRHHKKLHLQADAYRTQNLWDQAQAAELVGKQKAAKEITQLIYIENVRKTFKKLEFYFHYSLDCSMDSIKICDNTVEK